jgi:HAD superfamily hydrolase (TIGR01450 family)
VLKASDDVLWDAYDVAMLDLDGVVYIGPDAVPGASEHLAAARKAGMHLAYVTNNASRTPGTVAEHLRDLGIEVDDGDVVTSAQAAARLLADTLPDGAAVFVIGGEGLEVALEERGLRPVQDASAGPAAVVSGFHADLRWSTVIAGAILVRDGLPWVASNTDMTVPTPSGPGPGNGALVGVVARFADREPVVAGKPEPPLFEETLRRVGGERPLVVGDRLDTDIEGANRTGYDSLLVMTGVTGLDELVAAEDHLRPSYLAADLGGLARSHPEPTTGADGVSSGGWTASVGEDARLEVAGDGDADGWWRVVATPAWRHLDEVGEPVVVDGLRPPSSVGADPATA